MRLRSMTTHRGRTPAPRARIPLTGWGVFLALMGWGSTPARAAEEAPALAPRVSADLIDPVPQSRFRTSLRSLLGDQGRFIGGSTVHALEVEAQLALTESWSLGIVLPVGLVTGDLARGDSAAFGNAGAGLAYGGSFFTEGGSRVSYGFGLDVLLPSAPDDRDPRGAPSVLAAINPAAPQLYLPSFASGRARALLGIDMGSVVAMVELRSTHGVFIGDASPYTQLVSGIARVEWRALESLDVFFHAAGTGQIAGEGDIAPPLQVGPGVRFDLGEATSLAVSAAFNFEEAAAVVFGLDFGAIYQPPVKRPGYDLGSGLER